jgi:hypothetical protein
MTARRTHLFRYLLWGQLALVITLCVGAYLGLVPTSLRSLPHADLAVHALLFGLLGAFLDGALSHRPLHPRVPLLRLGPVLVLAGAGVEELAQRLSPRRCSSIADFAADAAGVCLLSWVVGRTDAPADSVRG